MGIVDNIMGWMKNSEKEDLFKPYYAPPSRIESSLSKSTAEQEGGFPMDQGYIEVLKSTLKMTGLADDMVTPTGDVTERKMLEARGVDKGSDSIIDSFIDVSKNKEGDRQAAEIDLLGSTPDGKEYNFTLGAFPDEDDEVKYYIWSDGRKKILNKDNFVTILNNIHEKMGNITAVEKETDKWTPKLFRSAWEQEPKVTVGKPYDFKRKL